PIHWLSEAGAYMLTSGTYLKQPWFRGTQRLRFLCDALLRLATEYGWNAHFSCGMVAPHRLSAAGAVECAQRSCRLLCDVTV
ncbi:MAG TPA: hypothetical protein VN648_00550, partial [Candidatus Methylomirabilis sp.]|nr:hypothetical protein [Candidatus Methylomirabilis sp.]